jgi:hypothetical protein
VIDGEALLNAAMSHAMQLGVFDSVNGHEPKSAPGSGVTCAVWVQNIRPIPLASGLDATSALVVLNQRVYIPMVAEPQDAIDPRVVGAVTALMQAYTEGFTLGGLIRNVDLLGMYGVPMDAQAGYLEQDKKMFRVMTVTLPLVVNDAWNQVE